MASAVLRDLATFGPDRCDPLSYEQAHAYTQRLARSHYENFTVLSWFLPRDLRPHFSHVYAFCRWADDLGDETGDPQRSEELLHWWQKELRLCYEQKPRHPVFVALAKTIEAFDIPQKPFDDLILAFLQDQTVTRYDTWEQVVDYCTRSADPVGRLVLYLTGYRDSDRQQFSDATCTALQLTNFWQDVRRDILERDRVYIPGDIAAEYGLDIERMVEAVKVHDARASGGDEQIRSLLPAYQATLEALAQRTWPLFHTGRKLLPTLSPRVREDIRLFTLGGESILRMIEVSRYETLTQRPTLSKSRKIALMIRAMGGKLLSAGRSA